MAYGDDSVTLATFDQVIPDEVFREVTSISLEQFRKLRDGGTYVDSDGQEHSYPGLFDEVVFDDSIREFLRLRGELADYFDETQTGDIFDYIPPQKTNQIFTPKRVVKQMVDMLEAENPGCFDRDDKTFADLYIRDNLNILDFTLNDDEMAEIAKLDKGERYYHRTDEQLDQFAAWRPEFEKA